MEGGAYLTLLAENLEGYANICNILTVRHELV